MISWKTFKNYGILKQILTNQVACRLRHGYQFKLILFSYFNCLLNTILLIAIRRGVCGKFRQFQWNFSIWTHPPQTARSPQAHPFCRPNIRSVRRGTFTLGTHSIRLHTNAYLIVVHFYCVLICLHCIDLIVFEGVAWKDFYSWI